MPSLKHLVFTLACIAPAAFADGIRFQDMPVGCRIHGSYSSGERVVDVYIGKKGSKHLVKTYAGPEGEALIRTSTYSSDGLLLRKDWAGGEWETFSPASCINVPGPCRYTYRNGDGAKLKYEGTNTAKGDTVMNEGGFVGEPPFNPVISTMGRFGAQVAFTEGDLSFKVTRYEGCDIGS